ncbi:uncharacterized protein LOC143226451 isoform X1 [Tachypleus tridentatus]|uniref:uncharacterized protein LOC143226451 isoform X1 n=1 Tax=Tachypleus tridentatus TaxID=6853 RepID=UPI003FD1D4F7
MHCVEHSMTENGEVTTGWTGRESSTISVTMGSYGHVKDPVSRGRTEDYVEEDDIVLGGDATNFLHIFSNKSPTYFGIPVRIFYHSHSRRLTKISFKKYKRITLDRRKWFRKIKSLLITRKIDLLSEIPSCLKRLFSDTRKFSKIQEHETLELLSRRPQQSAPIPELKGLQTQSRFLSPQGIKASSPTFHLTNLIEHPSAISDSHILASQSALFQDHAPITTSSIFTTHIDSSVRLKTSPTNLSPFQNLCPSNIVDMTSITSSNGSTSICIPQVSITKSYQSSSPMHAMQQIPDSPSKTLISKPSVLPVHNSFFQNPIFPSVREHESFTLQPTMKEMVSSVTTETAEHGHYLLKRPASPDYQPFRSSPTQLATEHQISQPITIKYSLTPSSASVSPPKRPTSLVYQHFTGLPTPTSLVLQQRSLSQPPSRNISPIRLAAVDSPSFKPLSSEEFSLPPYQYFPQTSTYSAVANQQFLSQPIDNQDTELISSKPLQQSYQFPVDSSQIAKNDTQSGLIRRPQSVPAGLFSFSKPNHIQTLFSSGGTPGYHKPTVRQSVSPGRPTGFLHSLLAQRSFISDPVGVKKATSTDTFVHGSASPSSQNLSKLSPTVHSFINYTKIATQPKEADYLIDKRMYKEDSLSPGTICDKDPTSHEMKSRGKDRAEDIFKCFFVNKQSEICGDDIKDESNFNKKPNCETSSQNETIRLQRTYTHSFNPEYSNEQETAMYAVRRNASRPLLITKDETRSNLRPSTDRCEQIVDLNKQEKPQLQKPLRPPTPTAVRETTNSSTTFVLPTSSDLPARCSPLRERKGVRLNPTVRQRVKRKRSLSITIPVSTRRKTLLSRHRLMSFCEPVTKFELRQRASSPLLLRSEKSTDSLSNSEKHKDQSDIYRTKERISKIEDTFERRLAAIEKITHVEKKDQNVQTSEHDFLHVNKQWKSHEDEQTVKPSSIPTPEHHAFINFQDLQGNKYLSNERKTYDKTASPTEQPEPPTRSKRTRSQSDTNVSPVRRDMEKSLHHKFSSDDCKVKETKLYQKKHVFQIPPQKSHHSQLRHQSDIEIPPPLPPKVYPKMSSSKPSEDTPPEVPERMYKNIRNIRDVKTASDSPLCVPHRRMAETVQSDRSFSSRGLLVDVPSDHSVLMRRHNIKQQYFDRPKVGTYSDDVQVKSRGKGAPVHEPVYSRNVSDISSKGSKFETKERKKYENVIYKDKTSTPTRNYKRQNLESSSPEHRQRVNSDSRTTRREAHWFGSHSLYADFERSFNCPEQEPFLEYRRKDISSGKVKGDHSFLSTSKSKQPWSERETIEDYQTSNREQLLQKDFVDWSELQSNERVSHERSGTYSDTTVEYLKKKLSNLSESEGTDELLNLSKNTVDELKISLKDSYTMEDKITTENEKQSAIHRQGKQTTEGTVSETIKESTKPLEEFGQFDSSASMFCSHSSTSFFDTSDESSDEIDGDKVGEEGSDKIKREKKLYHIVEELVTTEEKFVSALRLLNEEFRKYVNKANRMNDAPIIPDETLNQIFRHLPELQRLNENFLQELQTRLEEWSENRRIADLIIQHGPFLKLYSAYICDFRNISTSLEESKKKYPMFQKLVREFEALPMCKCLSLEHYMLKPIQRIPQYRLFLERYLKYLSYDDSEYGDTEKALDIITRVTEHANEFMKRGDNFAKLLSIQNSIFGNFEIVKPGRVFLKEGELLKLSRKEMQPRWFILFNDCLVSTTPIQRYLYVIHHKLPLTGMKVSIPEQPGYQNEFSIITVQRSYTIVARSPEIKEDWIKALSKAIRENATKRRSFLLVKDDDDMEDEAESNLQIGNEAPVWIPDKRVSMCQICTRDFKVTHRRHHCRCCGKVVCSACSANRYPLNYLHNRMARVCDKCLMVLQQESSQEHVSIRSVMEKLEVSPSFGSSEVDSDSLLMNSKKHVRNRPCVLKEVPASDKDITKKGYLYRMRQNKTWKKYWFLVKDKVLYMYRACEDVAALTSRPLLGYSVDRLTKCFVFQLPENVEDAGCFFQLTHKGQLPVIFRAENPQEADSWINTMRKATVIE